MTLRMTVQMTSGISVDCVVFGFDGKDLKVLLIKRKYPVEGLSAEDPKLPGAMILENETIPQAASRVLEESTGLSQIYLKQVGIFSDPDRVSPEELDWICKYHNIKTERVVTVGYYALVKLTDRIISYTLRRGASWVRVDDIHYLVMDHKKILAEALLALQKEMILSPIAFELLPKKFTISQLQNLFSAVTGIGMDNRNFRKKILSSGLLKATGEKERGVAHKPAMYYEFNRSSYKKAMKERTGLEFINNWAY